MARKKSAEELLALAQKAEKRALALKAQAKKQTEAENAKINAEVIKSLMEFAKVQNIDWKDMPDKIRSWTEKAKIRLEKPIWEAPKPQQKAPEIRTEPQWNNYKLNIVNDGTAVSEDGNF